MQTKSLNITDFIKNGKSFKKNLEMICIVSSNSLKLSSKCIADNLSF